ncbi:DUF4890 domain-containing protein [Fibrisoma montanum]|uniref:DUF4890 domain-containing protein n=1 Tax=Fibrisoma montanum TaxID=2305895 RepID=A0A418LX18_9BACT|nr:DUF4890 domain-containing protein [Fibrisoma montanum]RIV17800.1 DUF4890 domain-containing protein [Fibrisoma montanum]
MKRNLFLALFVATFTFVQACAQTTPSDEPTMARREQRAAMTPEQRADRQTKQMAKRFALSSDQQTAVAEINLKYAKQMQTLADGERSREKMKQARDLMASKDEELKKVFSADQYKQYVELRDTQRDRMKQNRGRRANS